VTALKTRRHRKFDDKIGDALTRNDLGGIFERFSFLRSSVCDFVVVAQPRWTQNGIVQPRCLDDTGCLGIRVQNAAMPFSRNLVVNTHRTDKDQTPDTIFLHRLHDVSRLLLQRPRKVHIHDILSGHRRFQRPGVQNIAFHDAHALCVVREPDPFGVPQVERQMCVSSFQEQVGGYASNLAVCPQNQTIFQATLPKDLAIDQALCALRIPGALQKVLSRVIKVAPMDSTVLITGETGTGKELIARAIHKRSPRAQRAFVGVNCAALAPSLISSELFGHERGAFTGAIQRRLGRFEQANGGTIFLDEVGDLPLDTQTALLRVLQEREFERVGGKEAIKVDVRVIAATNRDLEAAQTNGSVRSDLYYRLNVFPIEVPPLRERKEDIRVLLEYFVHRFGRKAGKSFRNIDPRTLELFQAYDWPGNIRELQNVVERSVIVSSDETFRVDEAWLSRASNQRKRESTPGPADQDSSDERQIIEAALAESRGRVSGRKERRPNLEFHLQPWIRALRN
jgi:Sigma-54 interaction domain